jgi:hypothetical protein
LKTDSYLFSSTEARIRTAYRGLRRAYRVFMRGPVCDARTNSAVVQTILDLRHLTGRHDPCLGEPVSPNDRGSTGRIVCPARWTTGARGPQYLWRAHVSEGLQKTLRDWNTIEKRETAKRRHAAARASVLNESTPVVCAWCAVGYAPELAKMFPGVELSHGICNKHLNEVLQK